MPTSTQNIIFNAQIVGTSQVINGINQINLAMNGMVQNMGRLGSSTSAAGNILQTAFGYSAGRAIVGTFNDIARGLSSIAVSAQQSISDFQRLSGVINIAAAREMMETSVVKERVKAGTALGTLNKQQTVQWRNLTEGWRPGSLQNMTLDLAQARAKLMKDSGGKAVDAGTISQDLQTITNLQGKLNDAQRTYNNLLAAQGPRAVMEEITRGGTMGLDQAMIASQGIAGQYLRRTQDLIMHAPVKLDTFSKMFQTLTGYGAGAGNKLGIVETSFQLAQGMTNFGIATGKDNEQLTSMAIAMGQVQSKGKLMAEEMNRQFNNAGITMKDVVKAFEMAYPTFGLTTENFAGMMKSGKIEGKMFIEAMRQYLGQWDSAGQRMKTTWAYIPQMLQNIKDVSVKVGFDAMFVELAKPLNAFIDSFDTTKNPQALDGIRAVGDSIGQFIAPAMNWLAGPGMGMLNDFMKGWQFGGNLASGIANTLGMGIRIGANQWDFKSLAEEAWKNLSKALDTTFNGERLPTKEGGGRTGGLWAQGRALGQQLISDIIQGMTSAFTNKGGTETNFAATTGALAGLVLSSLMGIAPILMVPLGAGLGLMFKDSLVVNMMPKVEDLTAKMADMKTSLDTARSANNEMFYGAGKSIAGDILSGIKAGLTNQEENDNIWYEFGKSLFGLQNAGLKSIIQAAQSVGFGIVDSIKMAMGKEPSTAEERQKTLDRGLLIPGLRPDIFSPKPKVQSDIGTPLKIGGAPVKPAGIPDWAIWDPINQVWIGTPPKNQPPIKQMQPNMPSILKYGYPYQRVEPSEPLPYKTGGGWGNRNPTVMGGGFSGGTPSAITNVTGGGGGGGELTAPIAEMNAQVQNIVAMLGVYGPQAAEMFRDSVVNAATSTTTQMSAAQSIIQQMAVTGYPQLSQVANAWMLAQQSGLTNLVGILEYLYQLMTGMNLGGMGMGIPGFPGMTMPGGGGGGGKPDAHARQGHFRTSAGKYENPFTSGFDLSYLSNEQVMTSWMNYKKQEEAAGRPVSDATEYVKGTADNTSVMTQQLASISTGVWNLPTAIADALGGEGGGGKGGSKGKKGISIGTPGIKTGLITGGVIGMARGTDFITPSGTSNDRYPFLAMLSGNERVKIIPNYRDSTGAVIINKSIRIDKVEINSGMDQALFRTMLNRALQT